MLGDPKPPLEMGRAQTSKAHLRGSFILGAPHRTLETECDPTSPCGLCFPSATRRFSSFWWRARQRSAWASSRASEWLIASRGAWRCSLTCTGNSRRRTRTAPPSQSPRSRRCGWCSAKRSEKPWRQRTGYGQFKFCRCKEKLELTARSERKKSGGGMIASKKGKKRPDRKWLKRASLKKLLRRETEEKRGSWFHFRRKVWWNPILMPNLPVLSRLFHAVGLGLEMGRRSSKSLS